MDSYTLIKDWPYNSALWVECDGEEYEIIRLKNKIIGDEYHVTDHCGIPLDEDSPYQYFSSLTDAIEEICWIHSKRYVSFIELTIY